MTIFAHAMHLLPSMATYFFMDILDMLPHQQSLSSSASPHQPTPSLPPSPHTHLPSPCWSLVDLVWSVILWTPTFSCACAFEAHLTSIEPGCQKAWLGCGGLSWLTGRKPSKASWLAHFVAFHGLLGLVVIWGMLPTWLVLP